jgi:hypothetical protein
LVNNAGVMTTRPIEQITEQDFDLQKFSAHISSPYPYTPLIYSYAWVYLYLCILTA